MDLRSKRMLMNMQSSPQQFNKLLDNTKQRADARCVLFASINPHNGNATVIETDCEYAFLEGDVIKCPMHVSLMVSMTTLSAPISACDFALPEALQKFSDGFIVIASISNLQNEVVGVLLSFFKTPFLNAQQQDYVDIARQKVEIGLHYQLSQHPYSERLETQINLLEEVSTLSKVGAWEVDRLSGVLTATSVTKDLLGLEHLSKINIRRAFDFFDSDTRQQLRKLLHKAIRRDKSFVHYFNFVNAKGQRKSVKLTTHLQYSTERAQRGRVSRLYGAIQDDSDVQRLSESQQNFAEYMASLLNSAQVVVMSFDKSGTILSVNNRVDSMLGFKPEDLIGQDVRLLITYRKDAQQRSILLANATEEQQCLPNCGSIEPIRHKSGRRIACEIRVVHNTIHNQDISIATISDATTHIHQLEHLKELAFRESVTGLQNTHLLTHYINELNLSSEQLKSHCACLRVSVKNTEEYERAYGQPTVGYILRVFAQRLHRVFENNPNQDYLLCKAEGSTFYLFIKAFFHSEEEATHAIDTAYMLLQEHVLLPVNMHNDLLKVHAQLSSCTLLYRHLSSRKLFDLLCDRPDRRYLPLKDCVISAEYCRVNNLDVERHNYIKHSFNRALAQGEFFIELQPQYNDDQKLTKSEVLVRWKHPQLGVMFPQDFITIAEECDYIADLDLWVCNAACELLSECIENGAETLLSLNLSARHLARGDFICKFIAIVDKWKLPRKLLSIELRESALVDSVNTIQARVYELVNLGFLVSIDDFGTANANFNILQTLPLTEIKVHKKFIANLASSTSDRLAVKHFCYLARTLRLNVVASGVENEEQLSHAKQCGCIAFQGYFLDEPMGVSQWKDKFQFSIVQ
ncbi:hypothetical protein KUL152_33720 [Tenacibaculum sp. KUL152]|nr:hypothetical protein KUL152_33720 [Tenacibaculum sp. KUL152]